MNHFVHGPNQRYLFSLIMGLFLQFYMFRSAVYHIYLIAFVAFILMKQFPRDSQQKYVCTFLMAYLSCQHIYAMHHDFGGFSMDVSTYTMILVTKLWGLSWAYKDGGLITSKLNESQIERRVVHFPTVLEYASFCCFCCGCIVGPFVEYSDFKNWIEISGQYKNMPRSGTLFPSLWRLLNGLMCLAIHIVFTMILGYSVYFCGSEEYLKHGNLAMRFVYYFIAMTGQRFMYYTPWCLSDASGISCGISYQDSTKTWDRIVNIYVIALETSGTPIEMMKFWNHQIHQWLKHYVQARVVTPGVKPGIKETMMVMGVSAFWHGFYPFYYFMFFQAALFVELAKELYRARAVFRFIPEQARPFVANFLSMIVMNYLGTSFCNLTFERGGNFAKGTSYLVTLALIALPFLCKAIGLSKIAKSMEKKKIKGA
jgi:lysophospholipid acyltransferase